MRPGEAYVPGGLAPVLFSSQGQCQTRLPRASALGLACPGLDGRKRRLNGIGRAQVNPVLGGEIEKGQACRAAGSGS